VAALLRPTEELPDGDLAISTGVEVEEDCLTASLNAAVLGWGGEEKPGGATREVRTSGNPSRGIIGVGVWGGGCPRIISCVSRDGMGNGAEDDAKAPDVTVADEDGLTKRDMPLISETDDKPGAGVSTI
jgi:hypothetical protein